MLPPKDVMNQAQRFQKPQEVQPPQNAMFPGFGPPNFEEEEVSARDQRSPFDNDQLEEDYRQFEQNEQGVELEPPFDDDEVAEDEGYGFTPPPRWQGVQDYPEPPSMRQKGGAFLRDEEIFEGGPTRSEVASWKKQFSEDGHGVFLTNHGNEVFIWRTLSRTEYREIMALPNTDPLQREEIICEICMLYPYNYNFSSMASRKAGTPAVVSQQIMQESGFSQPEPPIRL